MVKKAYSAPVVRAEAVEIGVFGSYGSNRESGGGIQLPGKQKGQKGGIWSWAFWPWNW
jgi:hypothetical protein